MTVLIITVDVVSASITEIHGPVDFKLLEQFNDDWLKDDAEEFREYIYDESEWCDLMLEVVTEETLDGRITAPAYYNWKIIKEGKY
jgi:hypothetical protein